MTRQEKAQVIDELTEKFNSYSNFYITDASTLTVADDNEFRKLCYEKGVEFRSVKNTLLRKALERAEGDYENVYDVLVGHSSIIFAEVANAPARTLKQFREKYDRPVLKAAYIDSDVFMGDDQIESLSTLKSKEELVGDIITILQSPAKNLVSGLTGAGSKLAALLEAMAERNEA